MAGRVKTNRVGCLTLRRSLSGFGRSSIAICQRGLTGIFVMLTKFSFASGITPTMEFSMAGLGEFFSASVWLFATARSNIELSFLPFENLVITAK
jgi:hypothetical protein